MNMNRYLTEICGIAVVLALVSVQGGTAQFENDNNMADLMVSSDSLTNELFSSENYEENVILNLFTRSNFETPSQLLINNVSSLLHSGFDTAKKTLLVIHGYQNNIKSASFQHIKNGALGSKDFNVIGVDWSYFTGNPDYARVVFHAKPVGAYVGQFIEFLVAQGLSPSDLHLIGHSLGAHVAGFAGKHLQTVGYIAGRITGLDPALPGFYDYHFHAKERLNATDADYVDCIHTCGGKLGIPSPICQADFFPNRGQDVQPGCSLLDLGVCSHGRAFEYMAESFNRSHQFSAKTCHGFSFWVPYNCQDKGALMGDPAGDQRIRGLFSLNTNRQSPFAKNITAADQRK